MQPLLNTQTASRLDQFIKKPSHALLLTGVEGVGLATIARYLAGHGQLQAFIEPVKAKTGKVDAESGTISVDKIRDLYQQMRGRKTNLQFAIIDNADRMSPGAQAAFLKLLEEPAPGSVFILTSHFPAQIIDTVHSRLQTIAVAPVEPEAMAEYERTLTDDPTTIAQLRFLAAGRPAAMQRIVSDKSALSQYKQVILDAQSLLRSSPYQRYKIAYRYGASQEQALQLTEFLIILLKASLKRAPSKQHVEWLGKLADCESALKSGAKPRLQLLTSVL